MKEKNLNSILSVLKNLKSLDKCKTSSSYALVTNGEALQQRKCTVEKFKGK